MSYQTTSATERLLTIADIARHFSLPESTARYYCKRFAAYMPVSGEGRRKRYRKEALDVIRVVLDAMRDARTASGVEATLAQTFPCNALAVLPAFESAPAPASPAPQDMPAWVPTQLLEQQSRALEGIASALTLLVRRQEALEDLAAGARAAQEDNRVLREELTRMRLLLDSSEKMHQDDMDQLRGWIARMARDRAAAPAAV